MTVFCGVSPPNHIFSFTIFEPEILLNEYESRSTKTNDLLILIYAFGFSIY